MPSPTASFIGYVEPSGKVGKAQSPGGVSGCWSDLREAVPHATDLGGLESCRSESANVNHPLNHRMFTYGPLLVVTGLWRFLLSTLHP